MPLQGPALRAPADVTDLLRVGLTNDPDGIAIVSLEDQMTWRQLDEKSGALARGYAAIGLQPGDRIASLMPNRVMLVVHYLACFRAGFVATPLNYRYATPELDHAFEVSDAQAIVAHVERRADIEATKLAGSLPVGVITYGDPDGAIWKTRATLEGLVTTADAGAGELVKPPLDAPAAIFFTSGSTGPAKGVTPSIGTPA